VAPPRLSAGLLAVILVGAKVIPIKPPESE
jgi:hypothetical protein